VRYAALLLLGCAALAAAGCGSGEGASPTQLRLEREDLLAVAHALQRAQGSVSSEVASTKVAWPLVAHGLPADTATIARPPIDAATAGAGKLEMPGLFEETQAATLTGPGAQLAGLFRSFDGLATRGWLMIGASIEAIEHGSPAAAQLARANVALYIESVYDGHFTLAQLGKQLLAGYRKLGGARTFGATLSEDEVDVLARAYSAASDRLHPHPAVHLGS
jgi:hypothetical protein